MASASGGGDTQDGCGGVIIGSVPRAGGACAQDGVNYRKAVQDGRPNGGDGYREEAVLRQQRPVHMDQRKPQQQGPQLPPRPIELEAVELSEKALRIIHANTEEVVRIVGENAFGFEEKAANALSQRIEETELLCQRCNHFLLRCGGAAGTKTLRKGRDTIQRFEAVAAAARSTMAQTGCAVGSARRPHLQSGWDELFALSSKRPPLCSSTAQSLAPLQMWNRRLNEPSSWHAASGSSRLPCSSASAAVGTAPVVGAFGALAQAQLAARAPAEAMSDSRREAASEAQLHEHMKTLNLLTLQLKSVLERNIWGFSAGAAARVQSIENEFRDVARESRALLQRLGVTRPARAAYAAHDGGAMGRTLRAAAEVGLEFGSAAVAERRACGGGAGLIGGGIFVGGAGGAGGGVGGGGGRAAETCGDGLDAARRTSQAASARGAGRQQRRAHGLQGQNGADGRGGEVGSMQEELQAAVRLFGEVSELVHLTMDQTSHHERPEAFYEGDGDDDCDGGDDGGDGDSSGREASGDGGGGSVADCPTEEFAVGSACAALACAPQARAAAVSAALAPPSAERNDHPRRSSPAAHSKQHVGEAVGTARLPTQPDVTGDSSYAGDGRDGSGCGDGSGGGGDDDDDEPPEYAPQRQAQMQLEMNAVALNNELIEQRGAAIDQISSEVRQLSELFIELAALVEAQDEPVRLVDERLQRAAETTDAARREIEKTSKAQEGCAVS